MCQLESLPTSRYLLAPKALLQIDARQLSGYGGSLETAVTDLTHYLTGGCRVVVLCGGQVRARNLLELLEAPEDPGGAGSGGGALPSAERGTHYAGYSVRRVRVPGPCSWRC